MKVAHVINRVAHAGTELQLLELVARSRLDHEVIELDRATRTSRLAVRSYLGRRLDEIEPDVAVAWLERPHLVLATIRLNVPRVAAIQGMPRRRPPRQWLLMLAASRYDLRIANSGAVRLATTTAARPLDLDPFFVVPNGIDVQPYRSSVRDGPLRVAFIGRAHPDKGLDVLLDALEILPPGLVWPKLVGQGVPEAVCARRSPQKARLLPRVPDPWIGIGAVDVLVVPSRSEGSPNVVLEAFARGIPVVATRVGGTPELLADDRGTLVPPNDPGALAAAIRDVDIDYQAADERARRAYEYVGSAHAWSGVVDRYDWLFECLATGDRVA